MCGIAGIHFKELGAIDGIRVERLVNELALGIEPRGDHATGIVAVGDGGKGVSLDKAAMCATDFIKLRRAMPEALRTVLIHTRFATQGDPSKNENNHPVLYRTCFAIHNGHISNDREVFTELGLDRTAEVDSEAVAASISHFGMDNVKEALEQLAGGFAIAAIDPHHFPDTLVLAKGESSPLVFLETSKFIIWASTLNAIQDAWGKVMGTPPSVNRFWQLKEGQYMKFCGAVKQEIAKFEVKQRYVYGSTNNSYWSDQQGRASSREDCVSCSHPKYWHGSYDKGYEGSCEMGHYRNANPCECEAFVAPGEACGAGSDDSTFIKCDGCYDWVPISQMNEEWSIANFQLCNDCVDTPEPTPPVEGKRTELSLVQTVVRTADRSDVYSEAVRSADDTVHRAALKLTAEDCGLSELFVEWLLFQADIDTILSDNYLRDAFEKCDPAYAIAESMILKTNSAALSA